MRRYVVSARVRGQAEKVLAFFCLAAGLYYCYRYALQYNSTGTSPTYSDTPLAFQIGKYALFAVAYFIVILYAMRSGRRVGGLTIWVLPAISYCLLTSLARGGLTEYLKYYYFILPACIVMFVPDDRIDRVVLKVFVALFIYHLVYEAVQILLFRLVGRLPALAYEKSLTRFGGGWDDPNAFGVFLCIPIAYCLTLIERGSASRVHYFALAASIVMLIITYSYSSFIAFGVTLIVCMSLPDKSGKFRVGTVIAALLLLIIILVRWQRFSAEFARLISQKAGSFSAHTANGAALLGRVSHPIELLFGSKDFVYSEDAYVAIFMSYGLVGLTFTLAPIAYVLRCSTRQFDRFTGDPLFIAAFAYFVSQSVGQMFIPHLSVFPLNYFYWVAGFYLVKKCMHKVSTVGVE